MSLPSYEEFYYQLLSEGRASYGGIDYTLEYPADPRPRCKICYNVVYGHQVVLVLCEGKAVYRLCNNALICPDNPVLEGNGDTFFFKGGNAVNGA